MQFFLKNLSKLIQFLIFIFCISIINATKLNISNEEQNVNISHSSVSLRTSTRQATKNVFYIAVDFKIPFGSHVTSPEGIGKSTAPLIKLTNCRILNTEWEKAVPILNRDGSASGYTGFYKNFTVLLKVSAIDVEQPINYDIFYVLCNKGCTPCQVKGMLQYDGTLIIPKEINKAKQKNNIKNNLNIYKEKSDLNKSMFDRQTGIFYNILIGLLGGLILNIMPCVFPVISIKLLSVAKSAGQLPQLIRKQCIAYSAGTIFTFFILGMLLCVMRLKLPSLGWGFYMQNTQFNYSLLILFLLCALHFLDIFKFRIPLPQVQRLKKQEYGLSVKSFFNGIFGAVTSAVCAGPFLGLSIGKALLDGTMTDAIILFLSIGIGLASPFLFIAIFPKYVSLFPKLTESALRTFSLILGTLMLLSCAWLISVLVSQVNNPTRIMWAIMTLIIVSVMLYSSQNISTNKISRTVLFILTFVTAISGYATVNTSIQRNQITWHTYIGTLPKKRPMFLNFSASWCLNCQFNSRLFNDRDIVELFKNKDIYAVKCDWTNRSEEISELLAKFGSVSVPFYVYYPKVGEPIILPTMLTKSDIIDTINEQQNNA